MVEQPKQPASIQADGKQYLVLSFDMLIRLLDFHLRKLELPVQGRPELRHQHRPAGAFLPSR